MDIKSLKAWASKIEAEETAFHNAMRPLVGMKAKIIDEKYNGQPYGRSRKPLKGRVLTIAWALRWNKSIGVGFEEFNDGCPIEGIELLNNGAKP